MSKDKISEAIKLMAKTTDEVYSIVCTVKSVDTTKNTCECEPIDGRADLIGVRLQAESTKGFLLVPEINSVVVVTMINGFTGYVAMFSDVSEIQLNGKNYNGLIQINDLKTQWDANVTAIKSATAGALAIIDTQLIALGQAGGSATTFNGLAVNIKTLNKTTLENTTVQHGNG